MSNASDVPSAPPQHDDDRLWTVKDAAAFLSMSPAWVYTAAAAGTLPCIRLGAALRFDPAVLRAHVRGEPYRGKVVRLPGGRGASRRSVPSETGFEPTWKRSH